MSVKTDIKSIKRAIQKYAGAYQSLEALQQKHVKLLQKGDQKTGVIGEFYSLLFLKNEYPKANIEYAKSGQKGWDLRVVEKGKTDLRVQVKTVSEYSKTRRISPIHKGWDDLFLLFVDKRLSPSGFWSVPKKFLKISGDSLKNRVMPIPKNDKTGSEVFNGKIDRLPEMLKALKNA